MSDEGVEDDESGADEAEAAPAADVPMQYGVPVTEGTDMAVLHPSVDQLLDTVSALKDDAYIMCLDVTAVDYLEYGSNRSLPATVAPERFEAVYTFISHATGGTRIRVKVQLSADNPTVPSIFDLFPGTEYTEREAHDMFGINFDGHPDLTRILMPEDWNGHPLRKDYDVGAIPVQFKEAPGRR